MHTLTRVVVVATLILGAAPALVAGPAAASASYQLSYLKQPNGKKIVMRWNPCRVHTYKVNLAAVPARSRSAVLAESHAAVRTLAVLERARRQRHRPRLLPHGPRAVAG